MRIVRVLLVIVAIVCLAVALSYPIRYHQAQKKNDSDMEALARMRQRVRQSQEAQQDGGMPPNAGQPAGTDAGPEDGSAPPEDVTGISQAGGAGDAAADLGPDAFSGDARDQAGQTTAPEGSTQAAGDAAVPEGSTQAAGDIAVPEDSAKTAVDSTMPEGGEESPGNPPEAGGVTVPAAPTPVPTPTPEPTLEPNYWDLSRYYATTPTPSPTPKAEEGGPTVAPTPTPDRSIRNGPLPYALKEKVVLDKSAILPELKDIYALNDELVGWVNIPDTVIDYPVVQAEDGEYYLTHDFYGEENINGQIILDALCDPYTPSYNLILSGHHMKNGTMFGGLPQYRNQSYWETHKLLEFDTLMERKLYVVFACFYSADYDEDETGFRYNAIIDYKMDADRWLEEIEENQLYDTGIEREFGDEFITLTTCDRARHRNGRFVVVGRKIREGETFE